MEHEEIFTLMMEALDGELVSSDRLELESHMASCSRCAREWQALQAIHQLFVRSPILSPAADFTQRTLALLPNRRYRIWMLSGVYLVLFASGVLPLLVAGWVAISVGPALSRPVFVRSLSQAAGELLRLIEVMLRGAWQGAGSLGALVGQEPAILGWLLVMVGAVLLWGGIYRQLTSPAVTVSGQ
jgi:anti-sigma factor RsiW